MAEHHVLIVGAGFAGLELSARLSETLPGEVQVTLIDRDDSFSFGFSKLDVMFGRREAEEIRVPYAGISKPGVEFRREAVTAIDPEARRVTTDAGDYEGDFLAIALGAGYDYAATPGFGDDRNEFYSVAGAARMRDLLPSIDSGTIVIGILGHPYKCPPAPFEGALLLHDHFVERGLGDAVEIRVVGPMKAPVPITQQVSHALLGVLGERGIEYVAEQHITGVDRESGRALVEGGEGVPFDLFIGVPVHRPPEVVRRSGLADGGWVEVDPANLRTRFDGVYALGDVAGTGVAKAGVFAEAAARVVADDIAARIGGRELEHTYQGIGNCFIEFGGGLVAKVEANFLGGPKPTAELIGPSAEIAAEKADYAATRRERWFGS